MIEEIKLYPAVELNLNKYVGLELRKTLPLFFPGKIAEKSGKPQREQRGRPIRQDHVPRGSPPSPCILCIFLSFLHRLCAFAILSVIDILVLWCQLSLLLLGGVINLHQLLVTYFAHIHLLCGCPTSTCWWYLLCGCSTSTCWWRLLCGCPTSTCRLHLFWGCPTSTCLRRSCHSPTPAETFTKVLQENFYCCFLRKLLSAVSRQFTLPFLSTAL